MTADLGVSIRTLFILILLLLITRILGRRTLSELTFYDFVIGLILGNIGASIITDQISIRNGILVLVVSTLWVLAINIVSLKSVPARKLIEAEPLLVINKGQILENNLKKRYYNVNDLLEMLREQGTFDPNQVEIALIEADGHLSVLKKQEYQSPNIKDLNIPIQSQHLASSLVGKEIIIDGRVLDQGLSLSGLTLDQLKVQLSAMGITTIDDVVLALITPEGKLYVDKKKDT